MTPADLRAARQTLGLSTAKLAALLRLGEHGGRTVRRGEAGDSAIPGPAQVAIELLLERHQAGAHPITPILLASAT